MTALATPLVKEWLDSVLGGDSQLQTLAPGGVWDSEAPQGTTLPFVLLTMILPGVWKYVANTGGDRLWAELVVEVKAVDHSANYAGLVPVANRIEALLHHAPTQAITGGTLQSCQNDGEVDRPFPAQQGIAWTHLGARYRILAQTV